MSETAVSIKIFKTKHDAMFAHIYKSKLIKLPLSIFKDVDNFNPERLQKSAAKAYPLHGDDDMRAVKYYQKHEIPWKGGRYVLDRWRASTTYLILYD